MNISNETLEKLNNVWNDILNNEFPYKHKIVLSGEMFLEYLKRYQNWDGDLHSTINHINDVGVPITIYLTYTNFFGDRMIHMECEPPSFYLKRSLFPVVLSPYLEVVKDYEV